MCQWGRVIAIDHCPAGGGASECVWRCVVPGLPRKSEGGADLQRRGYLWDTGRRGLTVRSASRRGAAPAYALYSVKHQQL